MTEKSKDATLSRIYGGGQKKGYISFVMVYLKYFISARENSPQIFIM